jgi:hypothetical protein
VGAPRGTLPSTSNAGREVALDVLGCLATPEALRTLKRIGLEGCTDETRQAVAPLLERPALLSPRSPGPRMSRSKLLVAMREFVDGKPDKLDEAQSSATHEPNEHWPEEMVGALRAEDLPLLRQVRRPRMTYLSDEALEDYSVYSEILMSLVWKPEYVK